MMKQNNLENVDQAEIEKFSNMAQDWWSPEGSFKLIHKLNPLRLQYVMQQALKQQIGALAYQPILDLGCGAGILAESLAFAGAKVLGIDMSEQALEAGRIHAKNKNLTNLEYRCVTAEQLARELPEYFSIICCMEMVEHVPNYSSIVASIATMLQPGGIAVMSTINRTWQAQVQIIEAVENYLQWLPRGTHEFQKFIKPSELVKVANSHGLEVLDIVGYKYNIFKDQFYLDSDVSVNYLITFKKK
ncbi:bifunctional 2-polyprenyl-6-hydroxyphenol methylase/3-demethylubiquinol 3-O-methyltransferase UbiG [Psittacicella gerlachiana]|uniref:Ubiquinone biosynthesis O-methyltransferase n=1 Tax=Psittacicella gerlachiana TaxID=2028574 RepID=A0A3A1Y9F2_9GAMM|nr:bifunctional 2-polyprenyl-6-hydroxyphenol methylase/3-demethylubiquinol 3-O-methyltransferase UbiG [Psittacicella gerlachiana]RIY33839.1 hypothetical protein CKF59_06100 [Psittacicella gerlachiana]